jgi:hypothetical protein
MRFYFQNKIKESLRRIAFNIEFGSDDRTDIPDVLVSDMSLIGTRMYRDPLGSELLTIDCSFSNIGNITSTCITDGGYFVDVNT